MQLLKNAFIQKKKFCYKILCYAKISPAVI